jgi:hypothetical protein
MLSTMNCFAEIPVKRQQLYSSHNAHLLCFRTAVGFLVKDI